MTQTVELSRLGGPGSGVGGEWRVVVLNDNFNTFDHVAETLVLAIPGVTLAQGYRLADQIPTAGSPSCGVARARMPRATGTASTPRV